MNANPNPEDRNCVAASILRPYFSDLPSDDIHIARQSDRKTQSAIWLAKR
ncbi:MAG: hypothetical protein WCS96_05805 [Victivallales bacterium]|jgi:hypothetical protein